MNGASTPPTIFDQFGRSYQKGDPWGGAYDPPRDPLKDPSTADSPNTFYRDIPITSVASNWNIDAIRSSLLNHRIGAWYSVAQLCDSIFADDRVQATLGSRTGGLFSQKLIHVARGKRRSNSKEALKAWRKAWRTCCPQSVMSELMRWAILIGFAIAEIRWDTTVTPWQPYLKPWHPQYAYYRWDLRQYQLSTLDGPVAAMPGTGKWLLFTPHGAYRGWVQGVVRAIAERWFAKQLSFRDWARYNERHGLPIFTAEVPAAGDMVQKRAFVQSLHSLGQEAVIGLPQNVDGTGYKVGLVEPRDRSWESFPGLIDRCDRSIVLPILWQNLTTEVKEGSFAAARVHGDVRQNAIEFDNETLSEAIYRDIARPWALFNYGDPEIAPYSSWEVTPDEDYQTRSDTLLKFAQAVNYLRQGGMQVKDLSELARALGLDVDAEAVDPVQVEARLAQATGQVGNGESAKKLMGALVRLRKRVGLLEAA